MVFVNLRDCQHSALDGKQRGGSYGDAGQSVLPPIKRLVGRDRGRVVASRKCALSSALFRRVEGPLALNFSEIMPG